MTIPGVPTRRAYLRRARHWIANRGFRSFLLEASRRLSCKLQRRPIPGSAQPATGPHPFDLAHGVDTMGLVYGETLFAERAHARPQDGVHYWVTGYYGITPSAFNAALARLDLVWSRFTFVDVGCGKGRAMLLAWRLPFREIAGVELAPELAAVAERNLAAFQATWRQSRVPARVTAGDATSVALPAGPLVLFLYHPFAGPVMRRFLNHVKAAVAAEPREVYLLYANPELAPEIAATPGFTQLWREVFPFSAEDVAADRFGSTYEVMAAFRANSPVS